MIRFLSSARKKYFNESLDFRARIFNILGITGFALGIFFAAFSFIIGAGMEFALTMLAPVVFAAVILPIANHTKQFKLCFLITVIAVFIIIFPVLFFTGGGYHSGMPSFFVFAVVFTVLMLEGKRRAVFTALEGALYLGCFLVAYFYRETVTPLTDEAGTAQDIIVGCLIASCALAFAIYQHLIIYDRKQKELERANDALQGLDRMKTEFYQNMNHDMKTPLTVISTFIGNADDMLDHGVEKAEVKECLEEAQEQIQILARMVEQSLTLAAAHEGKYHIETLDYAALLRSGAGAFHPALKENGNTLDVHIPDGLPKITGNGDLLKRAINNIMINAAKHTQNGTITVSIKREGGGLITTITDTGEGIDPAIFPRVFERGVSGHGATGYGLAICQAIVETHGAKSILRANTAGVRRYASPCRFVMGRRHERICFACGR